MIVATTHLYVEVGLKSRSAKRTTLASVHHIYVIYIIFWLLVVLSLLLLLLLLLLHSNDILAWYVFECIWKLPGEWQSSSRADPLVQFTWVWESAAQQRREVLLLRYLFQKLDVYCGPLSKTKFGTTNWPLWSCCEVCDCRTLDTERLLAYRATLSLPAFCRPSR